MAGLIDGIFINKVSPHLQRLMDNQKEMFGEDSPGYQALYRQFVYTPAEDLEEQKECNLKHYEACVDHTDGLPRGIERLYRRQLVIDLTMLCAAHCRYCLRANYEYAQLSKPDVDQIVQYMAGESELMEILITGGDPFMVPTLLKYLISETVEKAPNIQVIRIGTRLPVHSPDSFNREFYSFFNAYRNQVQFEIACQCNHAVELTPQAEGIFENLKKCGVTLYAQNVFLKGINDNIEALIELYDRLRYLGFEAHYLFHSIPMKGTHHLRTSVEKGLNLTMQLTSSGVISGRAKPSYALMTYVGKVTLYEGSIIKKDEEGFLHIKTHYRLEDRQRWNPTYILPECNAYLDDNGIIVAKYLDGEE